MIEPPDYGAAFGLWRESAGDRWLAYTRHRFVDGLCDGSLPRPVYLAYLKQDYVFLVHFARAWALAVTKSGSLEEMKVCAASAHALVDREMQLHVETCAAEGISEEELFEVRETPQNMAYTRYILEAGYSGDFLDMLAVLAPCGMGYGEIGRRLAVEATSERYRDWIDVYAGDECQENCRQVGALIDAAFKARLGAGYVETPRWRELCRKFAVVTELEAGFWEMSFAAV